MPELPEVETVVQSIRHKLIGNEFEKIDLRWPKVLFNFSKSDFSNNLVGAVQEEYLITPELMLKWKQKFFNPIIQQYSLHHYPHKTVKNIKI